MPSLSKKQNSLDSLIVLITSTIWPAGSPASAAKQRLAQYRAALISWAGSADQRIKGIVYVDNSSGGDDAWPYGDLAWVKELAAQVNPDATVETLSCPNNHIPPRMHYGYAELRMIDHAINHSSLLAGANYFAKATGRLQFPAFHKLLDHLPADFDACIDFRNAYRHESKNWSPHRARTQLMLFRTTFYRQMLYDKYPLMTANDISHIEELIAATIKPGIENSQKVRFRFPVECAPSGISGNGIEYDSKRRKARNFSSALCRKIAPWIWL